MAATVVTPRNAAFATVELFGADVALGLAV
jgi:hypothetical protein